GLTPSEVGNLLSGVDLPAGFEVLLATAVDPGGDPAGTRASLAALQDAGATAITCRVRAENAHHYCDQLAKLRDIQEER
ncbi:LLM class F420-dependent oxidoreductase, partial [Mycobacteriaceae bacterium Msp059]|nr:LLM class F420-dependent oxidoreductase [Mycobacteriaceae bacterium Msp059]